MLPVKPLLALLSLLALPVMAAEPTLYGRYEYIKLPEIGQTLKAKMDTGALTASLSAKDIETFTRDGEDWVRFRLATKDADGKVYEHKVARISKIKARSGDEEDEDEPAEAARRPVVDLELCLGDVKRTVEVNLTDRSNFNYPLLIGAKALREFKAAVNPARRYTADKPDC
nr:ATP-dependent zinc protease [Pseudomonas putida]